MDENLLAQTTAKALRAAEKLPPNTATEFSWVLWMAQDGSGERTVLVVGKVIKNDVKNALKAHRKAGGKWARGTVHRDGGDGLRFVIEDGKRLPAREATRVLRTDPPAELSLVKPLLKATEVVDAVPGESDGREQGSVDAGDDGRAEARCERARESAKEAFLAAKASVSKPVLDHLVELRERATHARTEGDLEEATERYLELVARARAAEHAAKTDARALLGRWREAIEAVDRQIGSLQRVLVQSDDVELKEIGEFGLAAITGNHKTPLQSALMAASMADGVARVDALERVAELAERFADFLDSDPAVAAVDENPFAVTVTVRQTLGPVLRELTGAA